MLPRPPTSRAPKSATAFLLAAIAFTGFGCNGSASLSLFATHAGADGNGGADGANASGPAAPPGVTDPEVTVPVTEMRRLSRAEVAASIQDLLGDDAPETFVLLPEDDGEPFDNDYTKQQASQVLVESADALAQTVAERTLANMAKREFLVQCTPTGPDDQICLRKFIETFGRRALRRPLTEDEIVDYLDVTQYAVRANDFYFGVELVIRSMLQDVEFLYRVEQGVPVDGKPGMFKLTQHELASRLAFTLWGRTPPDWLLDLADQGQLGTPEEIRFAAAKLLEDPKARAQVERFHAMWLGFSELPFAPDLNASMVTETHALIDKVVFDDHADYLSLFQSNETYANDQLVQQYGLNAPSQSGFRWVSYAGTRRKGILSHGTVLSNGSKQTDTSPTRRGKFIRERLFCQDIPPPPPNANADVPPTSDTGSTCKKDRYAVHAQVGSCASCHQNMDPVGFGLENFDREGKYRTVEAQDPSCTISGDGAIAGVGAFNGADGLSDLMVSSGVIEPCVVTQVFRFVNGRRESDADRGLLLALQKDFSTSGRRFDSLLIDLVSDPTFSYRLVPEVASP